MDIRRIHSTSSHDGMSTGSFNQKRCPLLGYGTINSDVTMEHEMQCQRNNSYACNNTGIVRSGVLHGFVLTVTSCNIGGTVGGSVLCGSMQRLYLENQNTAESVQRESAGGQTSLSLTLLWESHPWWRWGRQRSPHCCKSLCSWETVTGQ
jgi:hypothetical protein